MEKRISSDFIKELAENEIFVFGSNLRGSRGDYIRRSQFA
jgi:hypothetical protein